MATPAPPEDQVRLLSDALEAVRHQTGLMRKCLDMPGKLMDALKCWCVLLFCASSPFQVTAASHWSMRLETNFVLSLPPAPRLSPSCEHQV